jgi:hypothetical protein
MTENYRPDLLSERAPHINQPVNAYKIIKRDEEKNQSQVPDGCLTPRQTG